MVLATLLLSACASNPQADPTNAPDPLEPFNRAMLHFNNGFEKVVARPADIVYRKVAPQAVRKSLSNAANNLTSPVTFVNDLLQGKPDRAFKTLVRFIVNSTFGIAGFMDVAARNGLPDQPEDFGQTLGVWGLANGPYLVLPLIGPTTFRDGIGLGVDTLSDPQYWMIDDSTTAYALYGGQTFIQYDDDRDDLEHLRRTSIDFYSALRSAYLQQRASEVRDGRPPSGAASQDILDAFPAAPQSP